MLWNNTQSYTITYNHSTINQKHEKHNDIAHEIIQAIIKLNTIIKHHTKTWINQINVFQNKWYNM